MRGIFFRNQYGSEQHVFFGNARQLLDEHGADAVFLRYEDTGEPYTGKQPSDYVKEPTKAAAEDQDAQAKQAKLPRGQMAATAAAAAMGNAVDEDAPEPPQVDHVQLPPPVVLTTPPDAEPPTEATP